MNEFANLFVFSRGVANLLCLLSSCEIETAGDRRLVILLRGSVEGFSSTGAQDKLKPVFVS